MRKSCDDCTDETIPSYPLNLMVEKPKLVADASGQIDLTNDANWTTVGRLRARAMTGKGMESSRADTEYFKQQIATRACEWRTPKSAITERMDPTWRLRLNGRKLNVTGVVLINEIGREVSITTIERV